MTDDMSFGKFFLVCIMVGVVAAFIFYVFAIFSGPARAFGPVPKKDQCISVNALLNRNCAPVYMCNGTAETNADWCCSTTGRWFTEEQRLKRWYRRNCGK